MTPIDDPDAVAARREPAALRSRDDSTTSDVDPEDNPDTALPGDNNSPLAPLNPDPTESAPSLFDIHTRFRAARRSPKATRTAYGNFVGGNLIFGDNITTSGDDTQDDVFLIASTAPLSTPPFVEPPYYRDLLHALLNHELVIVSGEEHCGRRTAAVRALADMKGEVGELNPTLSGQRFLKVAPPPDSAFLLDKTESSDTALNTYELTVIEHALRNSGSKLVLLVAANSTTSSESSVFAKSGPDSADVLSAWLTSMRSPDDDPVDTDKIRHRLRAAGVVPTLENARKLATHMHRSKHEDTLSDALQWLAHEQAGDVAEHIARLLGDADERDAALYIATLVFSGAPEATIALAAGYLEDRLSTLAQKEPDAKRLFVRPLTSRIARLELCRTDGAESGIANVPTMTIALEDPSLGEVYLQHIWFEYGLESTLAGWLHDMSTNSIESSIYAGCAIAHLLARSPQSVIDELVWEWARSDEPIVRFAAALSVGLSALDPVDSQTYLLDCIQRMSRSLDLRARWTAVTSLGFGVGQRFPRLALTVLDQLGYEPTLRAQGAHSLGNILRDVIADRSGLGELSSLLITWMERFPRLERRSSLVATAVTKILDEPGRAFTTDVTTAGIPLCELIGALLNVRDTRPAAQRMIPTVLTSLPDDVDTATVRKIIAALSRGERGHDRLEFLLRRLTSSTEQHISSMALRFHQELGGDDNSRR